MTNPNKSRFSIAAPVETSEIATNAARYHAMRWSIIPLEAGTKRSPRGHSWRRWTQRRPRRRDVERWFGGEVSRNLAVVLGAVSGGLACRDFDAADGYLDWRTAHPDLAATLPTVRTRRGYHVYFVADAGDTGLPSNGVLILPDGELRVRNCHATLPPSRHPDGGRYEWIIEPFHGIQRIYSVVAAGLIPADPQIGFSGARARVSDTYQVRPMQYQEMGAATALFDESGSLRSDAFDKVAGWTLPAAPGMREHCLWQLARLLKSLSETNCLRVDQLEPIVRHWWKLSLPAIRTKEWALTWAAFARAWERASPFSESEGIMGDVLDIARRAGCPAELMTDFGTGIGGLVAAICRELASRSTNGRFFLDCRTLARLCGINRMEAAAYLKALIASRVIRKLSEPRKGKATEYSYLRSLE